MPAERLKENISRTYQDGSTPQIWDFVKGFVVTPPDYPEGYIAANNIQDHELSLVVYARHPNKQMEKLLFFNEAPFGYASELGLLMERWNSEGEVHMAFSVINVRKLFSREFKDNEAARVYDVYQYYRNPRSWDGSGVLGDGLSRVVFEDVVEWMVKPEEVGSIISDWFGIVVVP